MKPSIRIVNIILAAFALCCLVYMRLQQTPLLAKQASVYYFTDEKPKDYCYERNESTVVFLHFWKNDSNRFLNVLEICAARTAALRNPNSGVCMLMDGEPEDLPETLSSLPNFQWAPLKYQLLLEGSPLEHIGQKLLADTAKSNYSLLERSDLIRLLYLHKYGGKYLDTDCLTLKSLQDLRNLTGSENGRIISNGVLMFDAGNEFIADVLQQFPKKYRPGLWASGGPTLLTDVYWKHYANLSEVVKILPIDRIYPIHYRLAVLPFHSEYYEWSAKMCLNAYILHLWRHTIENQFEHGYEFDRRSFVGRVLIENGCL